uniref:M4A15 protein n=1 Tax=Panagrellus redivivus TaxID=6233 RepID=A0A7E4VW47_PANRE
MLEVCCAVCCRRSFLVGMPIFSAINAECMGAIAILFGINYYDDPHFVQYRSSISYGICFWIIIAVGVIDIFSLIFGAIVFKCTKDEKD